MVTVGTPNKTTKIFEKCGQAFENLRINKANIGLFGVTLFGVLTVIEFYYPCFPAIKNPNFEICRENGTCNQPELN